MANDLLVRILGDSRSLERAYARASKSSSTFAAQTTTTMGRVEAGFSRLQRVAAGGFIGSAALLAARRFVDVAAEAQQVLGQTRVAVEGSGQSWERYARTIEDTVAAQSRLGFDDEALLRTFSLFVRQTDDVGEALKRNNLAMDVARARFIDLEQAAQIVNKAALGQAGALRRLGIDARKGASSVELLTKLQEEFGGAAEAASDDAATAMDRFKVASENAQEALGSVLLPAVTDIANALTEAAEFAERFKKGLDALAKVKIPPIRIPFVIDFGGGSAGGFAGDVLRRLPSNVPTFGPIIRAWTVLLKEGFKKEADAASPELAESFRADLDNMLSDALKSASANVRTRPEDFANLPGVDFGHADSIIGAVEKAQDVARRRIAEALAKGRAARRQDSAERAADARKESTEARRRAAERAAELRREAAEARRAAIQARQFRALGLAATGEEIVPGVKNLQTRINAALRQVSSGQLNISSKLVQRLKLARTLIKKEGKDLTEDTRRVINDLLRTLTQGADKLADGPLTKTTSLNAGKILEGLGLGRDLEKELRARLSSFNSAGRALAGAQTRTSGGFRGGIATGFVVENHNTINLDGDTVARNVTKSQQGTRRRNPTQKRGRRSGI